MSKKVAVGAKKKVVASVDVGTNMDKWLNALRVGGYEQTMERLRDDGGFCCLGVACDLYMKETGMGKWGMPTFSRTEEAVSVPFVINQDEYTEYLPPEVADWLVEGIKLKGAIDWRVVQIDVSDYLNDNGAPFKAIAKRVARWVKDQDKWI